jgi:type VI secretion system secreted protein Hcp
MLKCATGEHIKEATLVARNPQGFLIVKLNDVLVTSVQPSGSTDLQMESVSLTFSKIQMDYKPKKEDESRDTAGAFVYGVKRRESK